MLPMNEISGIARERERTMEWKKVASPQGYYHRFPAVILAAGQGRRLCGSSRMLKPLTPLLGLTLLERSILTCQEAGITEYYVVVGYGKEKVISHIEELRSRYQISVRVVENPNWKEGNGTSVLAVSKYVSDPFLILMCDHLFEPDILQFFVQAAQGSDVCLLAVDRRFDQIVDLEDATKVRLHGQEITAIGKRINPFDAVDMGVLLGQPMLFSALEQARRDGDGSLSAGVRYLIDERKIQAVDVSDWFWIDVDTRESLIHAKRTLLANLSKPEEDGFISYYLNRHLSRRISEQLVDTPLTPNIITALSFLVVLCGAFLFSVGGYFWTLLAGLLVQLGSIVDGCDGEVARLKFQSSRFGAWFDTVLDRYADVAIVQGISYGYWLAHPVAFTWLGGILALTGFVLASYVKKEYTLRYHHRPPSGLLEKLSKRDLRLFGLFVGALLNRPFEAMILLGLVSHVWIGWILLTIYEQKRHKPLCN